MNSRRPVLVTLVISFLMWSAPQLQADPPAGYYDTVDTTNSTTIRATLHTVIDDHTRFPYSSTGTDTWDILEDADQDPGNASNIIDVYKNESIAKFGGGTGPYNREHTWPSSYGFTNDNSTNYPYTDCHMLHLVDPGYNTSRGNLPYDTCSAACTEKPTTLNNGQGGGSGSYPGNSDWRTGSGSTGTWETWIGKRGNVARALLYMDIRYEGGTHGVTSADEPDLILTDNRSLIISNTSSNESVAHMGMLSTLLQWHIDDPVDADEQLRNDIVFGYQGNRNPFIDHPEWVDCLFNDVCGGGGCTVPGDCDDGLFCNGAEDCDAGTCVSGSDPCPGQSCDEVTDTCFTPSVDPWINEFHYDNASSDVGEFVEIAGPAGTSLTGWTVVGYNGNGGGTYKTVNLSGTLGDQGGCIGTLDFVFSSMQNGSPDGLALVDDTSTVIQFISYEGSFTATNGPASGLTSTDIGVSEPTNSPVGDSLQLSGTGATYSDFTWQAPANDTPGLPNNGQAFDACGGCINDSECDDGVYCNGAEVCNAGTCEAGTAINCTDGVGCTDDSCNEATNSCDNIANDGNCDDSLFCNGAESCDALLDCQAGSAVNCDDGVGCTDDSCNETTDSCDNTANDANCDDGLFCNGAETCDGGLDCLAGGDPCPGQICDEASDTCVDCVTDGDCDDGLFCNGDETCTAGSCQAGSTVDCTDGVGCTDDSCNETTDSCDNIANDGNCDDGLFCNGDELCDALLDCQAGSAVDCDDGVACTDDSCNETTDSCDNVANNANCNDGLFCNGTETCDGGLDCQAGTDPCPGQGCDEATDSCVGGASDPWINEFHYDNASGDVGEFVEIAGPAGTDLAGWSVVGYNGNGGGTYATVNLSGTLFNQGGCIGTLDFAFTGMQNGSPDGLALVDDTSAVIQFISYEGSFTATNGPASGLTSTDIGVSEPTNSPVGDSLQLSGTGATYGDFVWQAPAAETPGAANSGQTFSACSGCVDDIECDDGAFCNGAEVCNAGTCEAGSAIDCDDGVGCTDDSCNETTDSCDNTANDGNCGDGLFCNGAESCDPLLDCQAGNAVDCDDGVGCTDDSCNEASDSCDNLTNDGNCDDGLFCNGAETCDGGLDCLAGSDPCPGQFCDEISDSCVDCVVDGDCDDGLFCNGTETCNAGTCHADSAVNCDDGVGCTDDSCNEATDSCDNTANDGNCDDGLFCNGAETCSATLDCEAGGDPCPGQSCDEVGDVCVNCLVDGDCDDGQFCNGAETCNAGSCQAGSAVNCDDGVGCTDDSCNETTDSCDNTANDGNCDDGLFCNGAETCSATLDCQAGSDPCAGTGCDEGTDTCTGGGGDVLWISFRSNTALPGLGTVADEDVAAYDVDTDSWSRIFDGSDVGVGSLEIDGLAILPSGDLLLSFTAPGTIPGLVGGPSGESVDDSDIVQFTPSSLGSTTAGLFTFYFDGSDVGLSSNGEDVDAIMLAGDGSLIISTSGGINANGASGADEDLWTFADTSLGSATAGTFTRLFDGSDVGLNNSGGEDIDAATQRASGEILFSTVNTFSVTGVTGEDEDVVEFTPTSLGNTTAGSFIMLLDFSTLGIAAGEDIGSLELSN